MTGRIGTRATGIKWLAALAAIGLAETTGERATAGNPATVRDGVYTAEQADRGKKLYALDCAVCHGPAGEGREQSPPLTGATFIANWSGLNTGEFLERIRTSMPEGNPGKLTRSESAQIVAFLLKLNGFPAGSNELPQDMPALAQIRIEPANYSEP